MFIYFIQYIGSSQQCSPLSEVFEAVSPPWRASAWLPAWPLLPPKLWRLCLFSEELCSRWPRPPPTESPRCVSDRSSPRDSSPRYGALPVPLGSRFLISPLGCGGGSQEQRPHGRLRRQKYELLSPSVTPSQTPRRQPKPPCTWQSPLWCSAAATSPPTTCGPVPSPPRESSRMPSMSWSSMTEYRWESFCSLRRSTSCSAATWRAMVSTSTARMTATPPVVETWSRTSPSWERTAFLVAGKSPLVLSTSRIVFNVEGKNGKGLVYAEKSKEMGKGMSLFFPNYSSVGQFYYLIFVQPETNKIIPIYDNREYVEREKMQEEIVKQLKKRKAVWFVDLGSSCRLCTDTEATILPSSSWTSSVSSGR